MASSYQSWLQQISTPVGTGVAQQGENELPWSNVANTTNKFMTQQAMNPYLANLPNYAGNSFQRSQNTSSMLAGQLPQDVTNLISQSAAERGIGGGSPGSQNSNAAFLRMLGLTSLDLQNKGSAQFSQEIADTPVPELWNPASLFVPTELGKQQTQAAQSGLYSAKPRTSLPSSGTKYSFVPGQWSLF